MRAGPALGASLALSTLAACGPGGEEVIRLDPVEHGRVLFHGETELELRPTLESDYACGTCHAATEADRAGRILPGAVMTGVIRRPWFWGGAELDLRRSVSACLYYFMLESEPLRAEEPGAQALYAYLSSLSPLEADASPVPFTIPRQVSNVPTGDASRGASVYERACAACHGAVHSGEGRGVAGAPALPGATLAEHPPGEYTPEERRLVFVEKVRHGGFFGYGGRMPPFSLEALPDEDLSDLLTFLGLDDLR